MDFYEVIKTRRSVRSFSDRPIPDEATSALDELFGRSRAYRQGKAYLAPVQFSRGFTNCSRFSPVLLQMPNPGVTCAATPNQWLRRFRAPKRCVLIIWNGGAVWPAIINA